MQLLLKHPHSRRTNAKVQDEAIIQLIHALYFRSLDVYLFNLQRLGVDDKLRGAALRRLNINVCGWLKRRGKYIQINLHKRSTVFVHFYEVSAQLGEL